MATLETTAKSEATNLFKGLTYAQAIEKAQNAQLTESKAALRRLFADYVKAGICPAEPPKSEAAADAYKKRCSRYKAILGRADYMNSMSSYYEATEGRTTVDFKAVSSMAWKTAKTEVLTLLVINWTTDESKALRDNYKRTF